MGQGDESGEGGSQAGSTESRKLIDLRECLRDSPRFRNRLSEHESEITDLETRLEKVVVSCDRMVNNGQAYVEACRSFSSSVRELAGHFHENAVVENSLRRFYDTLAEVQTFHSILFDQAQRSVQSSLRSFLTGELKKVKDMKKTFDRVSDELNSVVHRNAHVPRSKPQEAEELSSQLANMQTQFSHTAIDYGYHINAVSCHKGHHLLNNLLSYMRAQYTFFHQGYDLLREFDPYMRHVLSQVDELQKLADEDTASMNSRHNLVIPQHLKDGSPDEPLRPMDNPAVAIELEGYLFKRSSGAFKIWNRRWFVLRNNQLCYQSESKIEELAVVVEDLRICTFKLAEDQERRFCFEVVTPTRASMLQADSEALRKMWMTYLEGGIARALRISASNKKKDELHHELRVRTATMIRGRSPTPELSESPILGKKAGSMASLYSLGLDFLDIPGNDLCADCSSMNPKWASINLGIMLCIDCCGIHRNMGVHVSKIRSITLDEWEPEIQLIMCRLGNSRVNAILEYEIPDHLKKPTPSTPRSDREVYIKAKYVLNAFVHPHPDFARPEIPIEPQQPSLQQLLSSTRERQADYSPRVTPRSSPAAAKRMISPSGIRMRATKPKSYRPLSQSLSSGPDMLQSFESSEDDILRDFTSSNLPNSSGATSSMALLAENFRKLEKSGKLKNWNIAKLKTPRKTSFTQLSGKFSKSYQALNRRFRSDSTKSNKSNHDGLSDSEDLENSSAMPLLQTQSAVGSSTPPAKPPRTFKQRKLDLTGDGEADSALIYDENDDFSHDVLSAIKEMGVVAAVLGKDEGGKEVPEERFSKSLPNGGIKVLGASSDDSSSSSQSSSTSGRISPTPPPLLSPRTISPLATEPPARAFMPPAVLSPVHEGIAQPAKQQQQQQEQQEQQQHRSLSQQDSVFSADPSSPSSTVFEEPIDKPADGRLPSNSTDESKSTGSQSTSGEAVVTSNSTVQVGEVAEVSAKGEEVIEILSGGITSDGSTKPAVRVSVEKSFDEDSEDGFTEFQSAAPLPVTFRPKSDLLPRAVSIDGIQQELQRSPNRPSLSEISRLSFDEATKRMSMISIASADYFSVDEGDEEEDDNVSNFSAEFPELKCTVTGCGDPPEDVPLFSTPPSSPPMTIESLKQQKKGSRLDSSSERSTSNSPRPKSASPIGLIRRSGAMATESLLRRSCSPRPKSASISSRTTSSRGSTYEEAGEEKTSSTPKSNDFSSNMVSETDSQAQEGASEVPPSQESKTDPQIQVDNSKVCSDATKLVVPNLEAGNAEVEDESEELDDSNEKYEDAAEDTMSLEESSEIEASHSAISLDRAMKTPNRAPMNKSQSANTSPKTAETRKLITSSALTRSATDFGLRATTLPRIAHHRSHSTALENTDSSDSGTVPRRNLQEAPNRSKDEDYFIKLIKKQDKDVVKDESSSGVASFSDQDFADILRSSLRDKKVPMVRVEGVDQENVEQEDVNGGGEVGRDGAVEGDGGRGGEGAKEGECDAGQCATAVPVVKMEPIVIPDDISPQQYLYQSVCTDDMGAILCAKTHGADINFIHPDDEGKSPMLIAVEKCNTVLIEFLYQNGAKLTTADEKGRGCLHYAARSDDAGVVVLLLKRGAKVDAVDSEGKDPIKIAVEQENGDIVTLDLANHLIGSQGVWIDKLRVAQLKLDEKGNMEEQVAEVYKEFEVAVQVDPERMKRRSQASSDTSSITSRELK